MKYLCTYEIRENTKLRNLQIYFSLGSSLDHISSRLNMKIYGSTNPNMLPVHLWISWASNHLHRYHSPSFLFLNHHFKWNVCCTINKTNINRLSRRSILTSTVFVRKISRNHKCLRRIIVLFSLLFFIISPEK